MVSLFSLDLLDLSIETENRSNCWHVICLIALKLWIIHIFVSLFIAIICTSSLYNDIITAVRADGESRWWGDGESRGENQLGRGGETTAVSRGGTHCSAATPLQRCNVCPSCKCLKFHPRAGEMQAYFGWVWRITRRVSQRSFPGASPQKFLETTVFSSTLIGCKLKTEREIRISSFAEEATFSGDCATGFLVEFSMRMYFCFHCDNPIKILGSFQRFPSPIRNAQLRSSYLILI